MNYVVRNTGEESEARLPLFWQEKAHLTGSTTHGVKSDTKSLCEVFHSNLYYFHLHFRSSNNLAAIHLLWAQFKQALISGYELMQL